MNEIVWIAKAVKQFHKLPIEAQRNIGAGVGNLINWPNVKNVKKLVDRSEFRLRIGNFRVLFSVQPNELVTIIQIEEVKKRDEHTY